MTHIQSIRCERTSKAVAYMFHYARVLGNSNSPASWTRWLITVTGFVPRIWKNWAWLKQIIYMYFYVVQMHIPNMNNLPVGNLQQINFYSMSINRLNGLTKHYREHGCTPRTHKNKGRTFKNHLSYEDRTRVQQFMKNYAELHAILLPGRMPGYKRDDMKLLPSSETKTNVWRQYKAAMTISGNY